MWSASGPSSGLASRAPRSTTSVSSAEFSEHIDRLIEQLGDPRFTVRERAQHELADIGVPAFDVVIARSSDGRSCGFELAGDAANVLGELLSSDEALELV